MFTKGLAMEMHAKVTRRPSATRSRWRPAAAALASLLALTVVDQAPADAAAYTKSVYAPNDEGSYLRGWADLSRDCSGTYGCWNYMKIERHRAWGWEYVNGWWANNHGWNHVDATQPYGCFNYRTTVDSYNDVAGSYGSGVNLGPVGTTSNGTKIYRYRTTWSSGFKYHCR